MKKVILWSAPRCLSTVFYRSMSTLKNTKHFQELFSGPFYFGPERRNFRYPSDFDLGDLTPEDLTYDTCKRLLLGDYPNVDLLFSKEFPYCLPESMWHEMISGKFEDFIHTFLIRDPERAIYSNYKAILTECVGNLDPSEVGFIELYKLYNYIKEKKRVNPIVIDAIDLQTHPDETMKSYCDAVGIQFDPKMTSWEKGKTQTRYQFWITAYNSAVDESTGFIKIKPEEQKPVPLNELPDDIIKFIDESRFYYDQMKKVCLKPTI